jgi:mannan endo-1,4-beta-mannosidase
VVERYRQSPTIMMWELVNEPEISWSPTRPADDPEAFRILYHFTRNVSRLIKSVDPNHLVSLGTRGIYPIDNKGGLSAMDFARLARLRTIDACSYHDYTPAEVPLPQKAIDAIDECAGIPKPTYAGEVGINARVVLDPTLRAAALGAKALQQLNAGASGFLVWNWWPGKVYGAFQVTPGDPALDVLAHALSG